MIMNPVLLLLTSTAPWMTGLNCPVSWKTGLIRPVPWMTELNRPVSWKTGLIRPVPWMTVLIRLVPWKAGMIRLVPWMLGMIQQVVKLGGAMLGMWMVQRKPLGGSLLGFLKLLKGNLGPSTKSSLSKGFHAGGWSRSLWNNMRPFKQKSRTF